MNEYDLYVPLIVDGKRLPAVKLASLKQKLIKEFGGLTYFPQKTKGFWKMGGATFQDDIVILRVLTGKSCRTFWKELKADLQKQWKQEQILIVVRRVGIFE
jgi:hypothetical protein